MQVWENDDDIMMLKVWVDNIQSGSGTSPNFASNTKQIWTYW